MSEGTQANAFKLRRTMIRSKSARSASTSGGATKSKRWKTATCRMADSKCFCPPKMFSPIEFPPIWSEFRHNNQLCDGTVCCEDGTEFQVHRAILAAVSPYFKALFTNSINRNQPETRIACMNAPGYIFTKLMDFAYTGECEITDENLEPLIRYADQYEVLGVMQMCCQYILDHLEPHNCISMINFARRYFCTELARRGRQYIQLHFVLVLKCMHEFVLLPAEELGEILRDDYLNVRSEEIVFDAVRSWIDFDVTNRKQHLMTLLNAVRLGNLTQDFLQYILKWAQVNESEEAKALVTSIMKMIKLPKRDIDILSHTLLRPRVPHDILFAIGGWTAGSPTNFIETYDTRADRWLLSRDNDKVPRAYHGICELDGLIYMIGGFDGNEHFSTVRAFDPALHQWRDCACMYYPRCYVSVATHGGRIYAMGGYNGRVRMNSAERYNPATNQWELIPPMQRQRSDASATTLDDKIYIVGGFNGTEVMNSAEVYDTVTNQWSFIPQMISARSGVSLVAYKGALYALGGFNGFTRLASGERFTPGNSSNWDSITEMFYPRSNFATVVLDGCIFTIGGFNGSTTINHVECYDADSNEWLLASPMNLNRSALSACVISGLSNARDYSIHGRHQTSIEAPKMQSQGSQICTGGSDNTNSTT